EAQARKGCIAGDCENGSGTYIFSDGNKYVGRFQNGLPHGRGTVFYQDGRRYEGEMANGYLNGYGTLFTKNDRQISGYWKDGVYQPERQVQSPAPEREAESEAPDLQVWAVIIGVANYDHMRVLRYPDDDAYRMYAFLKSPEGGALDDEHIKILVDEEATLSNIKRVTSDVFGKAGPNDLIMLYFSGHGVPGAFLPADFMGGTRNQLLHEDLMAILRRSRAKHKLFLADACYSGSMLTARAGRPREEKNQAFFKKLYATAPSTAFIVSSKSNEISVESSGLRQGVFSHFLIRGLKGEADANRDRYVDVTELYRYVRYNVREYTGNKQSPLIEGQYDPNMPVSVR
ncbi:MAG TPA: caspase family protein, partial [Phaeodactylibacter sp.]|nr:caspase family protein [Phaeodactylibacter sp.]